MHSLLSLLSTFSEDNKARGTQFELLCKWYLQTDPLYAAKLEEVWLWDEWPGRWGADCGIDLVARDTEGKVWAIQAKCYAAHNSVTKQDIDSFLSESINPKIDNRLLIATTDGLAPNAVKVIKRQNEVVPVHRAMLTNLLDASIDWPLSLGDLSTAKAKQPYTPKPYQQTAINEVASQLDSRGQLIMACGTGKTLTALWIDEELGANTTLALLPSLLLLSKTLSEWLTHSKERFAFLPVCSDESIGSGLDAIDFSTSELSFPVTTDSAEIAAFLKKPQKKVIFSTYQSSAKIAEAFKSASLPHVDLIIADEAHRCAGKASSDYALLLDDANIPSSKRLFMTATPKIFQAHFMKKAGESGVDVVSMNDEALFGPVLHRLTFGEAIKNDLLTDYRVVVVGVDQLFYKDMIDNRRLVETDTDIQSDAQSLASHIGLAKAVKDYDLRRIITFHSRVKAAKDFANNLPKVIEWMPLASRPSGEVVASHVAGDMPTSKRNQNLQALGYVKDSQRYVLANARCLSEGVDVPALDGIAFIDPRQSEIDIVQAVGRAIRLSDGKELGTIVIPVFITESDDVDEALNSSPFKAVWGVVNALRSHDEQLGEELDYLRMQLGKRGTVGKSDKIIFDLPAKIDHSFEKALETKLLETTTASWEFWFGLLQKYKQAKGDFFVPLGFKTVDGFALGSWVSKQRAAKNSLSLNRKERLDEIGFVWDALSAQFEAGFSALDAYKRVKGDCLVPQRYRAPDGFALGTWVYNLKKNKEKVPTDKKRRLDAIGFVWDFTEMLWQQNFGELEEFFEEHGDFPRKKFITKSGLNLGEWLTRQRQNKALLSLEKIKKLDNLGMIWDLKEYAWNQGYDYLIEYKKRFGDCDVTNSYTADDGYKLGAWVANWRRDRLKTLSTQNRQRLESLGFIWNVQEYRESKGLENLQTYITSYGDSLVPKSYVSDDGYKLGSQVSDWRVKKDKLDKNFIQKLDRLGFIWNALDQRWELGFSYLKAYMSEHNHSNVPRGYRTKDGFLVASWVNNQRSYQKNGTLDASKVNRLSEIGFRWTGQK